MPKTLIWNPDGSPAAVEVTEEDRTRALLVELFGLLIGYNADPAEELTMCEGHSVPPLDRSNALKILVDIVGEKAIEDRYEGVKLQVTRRPHAAGSNPS